MNEINNKLYNTLNHYQNTIPQAVYECIYDDIKNAIIVLIVRGVLSDYNKDNALIEMLKAFRPNKTE